jgi:HEAT repeat protein
MTLLAIGWVLSLSACTHEFIMRSPLFMGDDPVADAKEKAKHTAELVGRLHEKEHTSFFGGEAEEKRVNAAWDLGHGDAWDMRAIPDLAQALSDTDANVRVDAAASLWNLSLMWQEAVDDTAHNAKYKEPTTLKTKKTLEFAPATAPNPITAVEPALRQALGDPWLRVRLYAARAFSSLAHPTVTNPELVSVLFEVAQGPNLDDAMEAADLAIDLGAKPRDIAPLFMRGIDLESAAKITLRYLAARPADIAYLPLLQVGAKSNRDWVRGHSVNLLGAGIYLNPEIHELLVDRAVHDPSVFVRVNAIQSLVVGGYDADPGTIFGAGYGPENSTVALLLQLMHDPEDDVRAMAATTLGRINGTNPAIFAAYSETLRDPDSNTRLAAAQALWRLGPYAKPAEPALRAIWDANHPKTALKNRDGEEDSRFVDNVLMVLERIEKKPQG